MAIKTALVLGVLLGSSTASPLRSCDTDAGFSCTSNTSISHLWGQYAPYFAVASDIADEVPDGCEVTFVQMLQRHGARFPSAKKTAKYAATLKQIHASVAADAYSGDYAFLANYTYWLGADDLTAFGAREAYDAGDAFFRRYRELASKVTPFVRSSAQERVVLTAANWTAGFLAAKGVTTPPATLPMVLLSEDDGFNNTLDASTCAAFEASTTGDTAQDVWVHVFVPAIRKRVNAALPGASLSKSQVIQLMDMCPMETVASASASASGDRTLSRFCRLFTVDEWRSYDYYQSLGKYYGHGNGNALGPAQGVGFVNEVLARLTGDRAYAMRDATTVNHTLDASAATFPLPLGADAAEPRLFADFSHDDPMTSIFAAFGFYNATAALSTTAKSPASANGGYSAAWTVPFAGRVFIEKQTCRAAAAQGRAAATDTEYIRAIINDRVIPLQNCGADALGRCKVEAFIDSLTFAQSGGNWAECSE